MDYTVGSLSDIITGSNTPNKPKVVAKTIVQEIKSEVTKEPFKQEKNKKTRKVDDSSTTKENGHESDASPKVRKLKKEKNTESKSKISLNSPEVNRKHKLEDASKDEPSPKKIKNEKNAERRVKNKEKTEKIELSPEELSRTVFVGNLPIAVDKLKVEKFFRKFGNVESVRIRSIAVADPKIPKKVAAIKKEFHQERSSCHGYVKFENAEDAIKATEVDGVLFKDHHLRVQLSHEKVKPDESKAVFIGNLCFNAEEDELWNIFESCGPIASVRIVRDPRTGMGKGFGYVNFQNSNSVQLALGLDANLKGRELRIKLCNINAARKNRKNNKIKEISKSGKPRTSREKNKSKVKGGESGKEPHGPKLENTEFQGTKISTKKKKNKINKGLLQKKKMIRKLAPKAK